MKLVIMREFLILDNMRFFIYKQLTNKKNEIKIVKKDITEKIKHGTRKKLL